MLNKNIKTMFLFLTLIVLLVGVVSAQNTTDTAPAQEKIIEKQDTTVTNNDKLETPQKTYINKNDNNKTKTSTGGPYTTSVSNYEQLAKTIEDANSNYYDTYTINLNKGNYYATTNMTYNNEYQSLIINANGITLDGQKKYQFISIENKATFTINNAILQNFKATGGGAIFADDDTTVTITKSTFKNNQAEKNGGAVYVHNKLTIKDSQFTDNTATYYGGALHSYYGDISITNTQFNNNKVINQSGGAIGNFYGKITIDESVLNNNYAQLEGGALYSSEGIITMTNSNITNNNCEDYGGGISTEKGTLILKNNNFVNNKNTDSYGGAVSTYKDTIDVTNNQFNKNHAEWRGGAIYTFKSEGELINNTFTANTAYNGGALLNENGNITIRKSTFQKNIADADGGAIGNILGELKVTDSVFNDNNATYGGAIENIGGIYSYSYTTYDAWGRPDTTTYHLEVYGNTLIAKNTFTNNYATTGGAIGIYVSQSEGLPPSDLETSNGGVQINYNTFDKNQAESIGGAICLEESQDAYIMNNTFRENTAPDGGAIAVTEKCEEDINIAFNTIIKNTAVNGSAIMTKGNDVYIIENLFVQNKLINSTGSIKNALETVTPPKSVKNNTNFTTTSYPGQIYTNGTSIIEDNTVYDNKTDTSITLTVPTTQVIQYQNAKITGKLTTKTGETIPNAIINLEINTKTLSIKTDSKGVFTYNYNATTAGTNKVTAAYDENLLHLSTTTTKTFKVIKETKITITKITSKQYKDNITITGKFTDKTGKALGNSKLKLSLNGKNVTVKTNTKGVYTYNTKANILAKNNVTVTFAGNTNYRTSTAKTTFTVTKRTTKATITKIAQKTYKQNVTITGKLTDKTGTILKNTKVKVKVNSKTYTVKTNSKGVYTLKVTANKVGTNNVTVTYAGNKYYNAVTKKTTFKTVARATKLTVNKISTTTKGKKIKITGKLADNIKSPVINSLVKIKINKKTVTVKTNKQGVYTYTYKTTTKGNNTITVTFAGNTNYKKTTAKTTFKVK